MHKPNHLKRSSLVRHLIAGLAFATFIVTACSSTNINVPAIPAAEDGNRLPGKIIWHELLTDTPQQTKKFYSILFGWEFEAVPDARVNYMLIRHEGGLIGGMIDQTRLPNDADISQWVSLLSVTDVAAATGAIRDGGGTVFTPPTSLGERGEIAIVADPQGALFALLQTRDGDPADVDETPPPGRFLWSELWTGQVEAATEFYKKLAPFQVEQRILGNTEHSVSYQVLSSGGRVRVGIRDNPFGALPPVWVNYLRVADTESLEAILAQVEPLGGEILIPATQRPAGGTVAVIAGPSGAGIALQTWSDDQTLVELAEEQ